MAGAEHPLVRHPDGHGWAELADGRWSEARAAFAAALETDRTPESLEGLSWAAWWLDDADAVFASRERAFRLYRRRGDAAAAARMAIWLAIDELDFHGAHAVANGWLARARRLLEPLEPCAEHGWLAFQEGYHAQLAGDTVLAAVRAEQALGLGRRLGVVDVEMLGLALLGAVRVSCTEIAEGMRDLDEATALALAGEAAIPIAGAWTCCFLVGACEAVRDYPRAFEWCDRIEAFARRYGSRYMLGFCGAHYAVVHLWRGHWREAEVALHAAAEAFSRSRPAMAGGPRVLLAELRRRQGLKAEAERLLGDAVGGSAQLCRAELRLDRGDSRAAAELAERVLRKLPPRRRLERAGVLEVLARASVRAGDVEAAASAVHELGDTARRVGTAPLHAAADHAAGLLTAARGDVEGARRLLEDAVDRFTECGAPYEAARAKLDLAACLRRLGRDAEAGGELRAARDALTALGVAIDGADAAAADLSARDATRAAPLPRVTRREREVLACLAEGLTNRGIAERLVVSEHTVHRHISNILRKLDLPSRSAAAAQAALAGLLEPPVD